MSHNFGELGNVVPDEEKTKQYLSQFNWPIGFQNTLIEQLQHVPLRFFICDDSGSMQTPDGKMVATQGQHFRCVDCSRWCELTQALSFHLDLSREAHAPCEFRLLNGKTAFIGDSAIDPDNTGYRAIKKVFDEGSPHGVTPLCKHINEVVAYIRHHENELRQNNQVVSVIICSDGVASDGDVTKAMKPLKGLPCMIVVRLCTSEYQVVEYWDRVEKDLEMSLDIIDDFFGEAEGVMENNSWINYGEPLQRLREFGVRVVELDLIDERKLTMQQMVTFMSIVFGVKKKDIPDPNFDWGVFESWVVQQNGLAPKTFNPTTKYDSIEEWINVKKLRSAYKPGGDCCIIN